MTEADVLDVEPVQFVEHSSKCFFDRAILWRSLVASEVAHAGHALISRPLVGTREWKEVIRVRQLIVNDSLRVEHRTGTVAH